MSPFSVVLVALAIAVLALAEPEAENGFGSQSSSGGNRDGLGGRQRSLPYGADINVGRNSFEGQRSGRSPGAAQLGGRGGYRGNGGGFGGNGGGFGGGRGGGGGSRGGNAGGFGGSSYARPQQQQSGLPYGANTPFGNQQNGGFERQGGGFGGQNRGFGGGNGQGRGY